MSELLPEQAARQKIDAMLSVSGWAVQSINELNLFAAKGVAVREIQSKDGPADYMLFVGGKANYESALADLERELFQEASTA